MIAWFGDGVQIVEAQEVSNDEKHREFVSPVRSDDLQDEIHWNRDGVYQRVRLPAVMQPTREVTRYEAYVIDTTGRSILASLRVYWRLADGTCFSAL